MNEASAVQKILTRLNIPTLSLPKVCGLNVGPFQDYQGKKDDEDEKSQKLSALKTAMELLIVPIFVLYLFCRRVEGRYVFLKIVSFESNYSCLARPNLSIMEIQ